MAIIDRAPVFVYDPFVVAYVAQGLAGWWEIRVNDHAGLVRWRLTLDGKAIGDYSGVDGATRAAAIRDSEVVR